MSEPFTWAGREHFTAKEYHDLMMQVLDLKFKIACIAGVYEGKSVNFLGEPLSEQEKAYRRDYAQAVALGFYQITNRRR